MSDASNFESRIAYLEAQNAGLKRVGLLGLLLVLILGGIVVHQAWSDLSGVTTSGIVFQDNRQPRAALVTAPSGHLAVLPAGPMGTLPAMNAPENMDFQGLAVYDSQGRVRILLGLTSADQPVVGVIGENGQTLWTPLAAPPKAAAPSGTPGAPTPGAPSTP